MNIPRAASHSQSSREAIWRTGLLAATTLSCALRIVWFRCERTRQQSAGGEGGRVVVWGSPSDAAYVHIVEKGKLAQRLLSATPFTEPYKGEVGTVFLFRRAN